MFGSGILSIVRMMTMHAEFATKVLSSQNIQTPVSMKDDDTKYHLKSIKTEKFPFSAYILVYQIHGEQIFILQNSFFTFNIFLVC